MSSPTIAVVGLGYVGLPLAVEFGKIYRTFGFDRSEPKIAAYKNRLDPNGEISTQDFEAAKHLARLHPVRPKAKACAGSMRDYCTLRCSELR